MDISHGQTSLLNHRYWDKVVVLASKTSQARSWASKLKEAESSLWKKSSQAMLAQDSFQAYCYFSPLIPQSGAAHKLRKHSLVYSTCNWYWLKPSSTFLSLAFCFAVYCFFLTLTKLCSQQLHCKGGDGCHINISSLFNICKLENFWQGWKINKHLL